MVPRWGVYEIEWDWLEEKACFGSRVSFDDDPAEPMIRWDCECCDGGAVPVLRCSTEAPPEAEHPRPLEQECERLRAEVKRLQAVIDSRPAINAGLPETYIRWSQSIYVMEHAHMTGGKPS